MARNIKINCRRVYNAGSAYLKYANDIKRIQEKMANISNSISEIWNGHDNTNFLIKFGEHITYLNNLIDFLNDKGELLKQNALNHNNADREFLSRMRRSDLNE